MFSMCSVLVLSGGGSVSSAGLCLHYLTDNNRLFEDRLGFQSEGRLSSCVQRTAVVGSSRRQRGFAKYGAR